MTRRYATTRRVWAACSTLALAYQRITERKVQAMMGLKSTNSVHYHLRILENAGYVHGRNSKKLTESAYETLIAEDRAWLSANAPESLERRHIDLVLKTSIEQEYPSEESTLADRVGPIDRYSPDGLFVGAPGSGFFVEAQRRHGTWDFFLPRPASPDEAVWFGWALIAAGREAAK